MIEYKVVTADDARDLAKKVSIALTEGWQLCGGVSVSMYPDRPHDPIFEERYAQAMTREKASE